MAEAKICGLNDVAGLEAALTGGARFVGFVFYPKSPRHVTAEQAASLAALARGRADIVAVTVNAEDGLLAEIAKSLKPDWIQAHGSETPVRVAAMRQFADRGVIKAIPVAVPADLEQAEAYIGPSDLLMFDAKAPPGADLPGGNGAAFDWTMLKGRRFLRPYLLSGGLNPANVVEATQASGARLVDVSSGVETRPGLKDPARISAFLAAVKAAN